jgi:hypothetical protein
VVLLTSRPNVVVAGRLIGEGALASQTFSTSSAAARVALAIHRAYGGGEAELRVLERDGTEVGRTRLTLDDLPPNTWVTVEIASPEAGVRYGEAAADPSGPSAAAPGDYRAEIAIVRGDGTLELWGTTQDVYADGTLTVDGVPGTDLSLVVLGPESD